MAHPSFSVLAIYLLGLLVSPVSGLGFLFLISDLAFKCWDSQGTCPLFHLFSFSLHSLPGGGVLLHSHGLICEPALCFWAVLSVCPLSVFTWMLYVLHKPNSAISSQNFSFSTSSSGFPISV